MPAIAHAAGLRRPVIDDWLAINRRVPRLVDVLPNGNYLVSQQTQNAIQEIDSNGKVIRQINYNGVFRATRLANGNTLAVSMNFRKVAELDRNGTVVWETTCQGRQWNIHFR